MERACDVPCRGASGGLAWLGALPCGRSWNPLVGRPQKVAWSLPASGDRGKRGLGMEGKEEA